jgi:hypothetical protein
VAGRWVVEENYDLGMYQEWFEIYTSDGTDTLKFLCNSKEYADWLCELMNSEDKE